MPARLIPQVELDKLPINRTLSLKGDNFAPRGILVTNGGSVLLVQGQVSNRLSIWIANDSTATIYVSGDKNVSATSGQQNTGWPIWQQTAVFFDDVDHELWAIGSASSHSVMVLENIRTGSA